MFRNFINVHDFKSLFKKVSGNAYNIIINLFRTRNSIVKNKWNSYELEQLESILDSRFNYLVTGDPKISRFEYACRKYLMDRKVIAASLGCGSGEHEISWARQETFSRIDCCDISPIRIQTATKNANNAGLGDILNFTCADVLRTHFPTSYYDVIILESALHHLSPLDQVMMMIKNMLKPGGLIFMTDFIGPTKFQWHPRQLQVVNALIELLPHKYLFEKNGQRIQRLFKPSYLRMHLMDPSEAVESGNIVPSLRSHFQELEFKNAGGAIINHLFPSLLHNFHRDDTESQRWLRICVEVEDLLLNNTDEIGLWYGFGVYRNSQ